MGLDGGCYYGGFAFSPITGRIKYKNAEAPRLPIHWSDGAFISRWRMLICVFALRPLSTISIKRSKNFDRPDPILERRCHFRWMLELLRPRLYAADTFCLSSDGDLMFLRGSYNGWVLTDAFNRGDSSAIYGQSVSQSPSQSAKSFGQSANGC